MADFSVCGVQTSSPFRRILSGVSYNKGLTVATTEGGPCSHRLEPQMWGVGWAQAFRPWVGLEATPQRWLWLLQPQGHGPGPPAGLAQPSAIHHNCPEQEWPLGKDRFPKVLEPERAGSRIWMSERELIRDYESCNSLPGPLRAGTGCLVGSRRQKALPTVCPRRSVPWDRTARGPGAWCGRA